MVLLRPVLSRSGQHVQLKKRNILLERTSLEFFKWKFSIPGSYAQPLPLAGSRPMARASGGVHGMFINFASGSDSFPQGPTPP